MNTLEHILCYTRGARNALPGLGYHISLLCRNTAALRYTVQGLDRVPSGSWLGLAVEWSMHFI